MTNATIQKHLADERGTLYGQGKRGVALVYPSPYGVGMSSLGFQSIYKVLNALPDTYAQRAFLPEGDDAKTSGPLLTYEGQRPASDFPVVAFSVAYELEVTGVLTCLQRMGVPLKADERGAQHPWVVLGGPLTFSNPVPLGPFADVIVMGEGEDCMAPLLDVLFADVPRVEALKRLASMPGFYVPALHGEVMPPVAKTADACLPASSVITTPHAALSNMHLVEVERGCSRGCAFCVMRRSTNGGMRVIPVERVLGAIPEEASRVGLVGAAVSDHPRIVDIMRALVERGQEIGLSSLRADRLTPEFVELLMRGGYKTLTIASDGASERLRVAMLKKIREKHLRRAAELARDHGLPQLKMYMMAGVPDETDADLQELVDFCLDVQSMLGRTRLSLGLATFVAKRNTPWDGGAFVGVRESDRRIELLRRGLAGKVEVRPISSRWAWVEYVLAQGGFDAGLAALQAWRQGGRFGAWRKAFRDLPLAQASYAPQAPTVASATVAPSRGAARLNVL